MQVTAELSLYPLSTDYERPIIAFIKILKTNRTLKIYTHSMSTYVKGESTAVFRAINDALVEVADKGLTASLVIKMINRDLPVDKGFLEF